MSLARRLFVAVVVVHPVACTLVVDTSGFARGTTAPGPDAGREDAQDSGGRDSLGLDGSVLDALFDATPPSCGVLRTTETLVRDVEIKSCNAKYHLILQGDGNLVLYTDVAPNGAVWATDTYNTDGDHAVMQADGDFVLFGGNGARLFETNTHGSPGAYLDVMDNGTLAVIGGSGVLWSRP